MKNKKVTVLIIIAVFLLISAVVMGIYLSKNVPRETDEKTATEKTSITVEETSTEEITTEESTAVEETTLSADEIIKSQNDGYEISDIPEEIASLVSDNLDELCELVSDTAKESLFGDISEITCEGIVSDDEYDASDDETVISFKLHREEADRYIMVYYNTDTGGIRAKLY